MTAPALRRVYDEVHFPLMVPHQIAQGATLSTDEGVRGFKPLKNQHEVALTFLMQRRHRVLADRGDDLERRADPAEPDRHVSSITAGSTCVYTTGGAVQMVALRTPRATYWVVEHDPQRALELDDDRDRREPPAAAPLSSGGLP